MTDTIEMPAAKSALENLEEMLSAAFEQGVSNIPQLRALLHIGTGGRRTVTEIALHVGLSTAAITGTLDRLEAQGFVVRHHDRLDRRKVYAVLTQTGDQFVSNLLATLANPELA